MQHLEIVGESNARIKVVGVGGGGGNAINNMIESGLQGVTFIGANTDIQALNRSLADHKIQLGDQLSKGLGAGGNPDMGRAAAEENLPHIKELLEGTDMVFVTAGMGGGTGTGAAPVISWAAKEMGALTVAVVTKPFFFEGKQRLKSAESGIKELKEVVDSLITIPNDRLLALAAKKASFLEMLKKADEVLYYAVKGISDLIMVHGLINLDFADVKTVMGESGLAMMGTGISRGETRAREAATKAITSPLLEDVSIDGARGVLINITCSMDMTIEEVSEAASLIQEAAHEEAQVFFGTVFDDSVGDEMRITVIATGIEKDADDHGHGGDRLTVLRNGGTAVAGRPSAAPAGEKRAVGSAKPRSATGSFSQEDYNIPAYLRYQKRQQREQETQPVQAVATGGGEEEFVFDEEEFEIPSFIRKQAD